MISRSTNAYIYRSAKFNFSEIQNLCKIYFKIERAYAPMFQNIIPVVVNSSSTRSSKRVGVELNMYVCSRVAIQD
jgi:hypothetical protein